jgi:hypothetical protein
MAKSKDFGTKFYLHVLTLQINYLTMDELENIIDKNDEIRQDNPWIKEVIFTRFFVNETRKNGQYKQETFDRVFNLLSQNSTSNDWHFCDIAGATKNIELINKCKKLIRTPHIKRELNAYLKILAKE